MSLWAGTGEGTERGAWLRVRTASSRVAKPAVSASRTLRAWRWVSGRVSSVPDCMSDSVVETVERSAVRCAAIWSSGMVGCGAGGDGGGLGDTTRRRLPSVGSVADGAVCISVGAVWGDDGGGCCDAVAVSMVEVACEGTLVGAVAVD